MVDIVLFFTISSYVLVYKIKKPRIKDPRLLNLYKRTNYCWLTISVTRTLRPGAEQKIA